MSVPECLKRARDILWLAVQWQFVVGASQGRPDVIARVDVKLGKHPFGAAPYGVDADSEATGDLKGAEPAGHESGNFVLSWYEFEAHPALVTRGQRVLLEDDDPHPLLPNFVLEHQRIGAAGRSVDRGVHLASDSWPLG